MRIGKHRELLAKRGFVPVSEAAEKVGVHVGTISRWADERLVESTRVVGVRFINMTSLLKHMGPEATKLLGIKGP